MTAAAPELAEPSPVAVTRERFPRPLVLTVLSAFALLVFGALWAIAQTQSGCSFLDMAPSTGILPGPQPCAPDATSPALVTMWLLALLLAAAFVVAFTVVRRRTLVLLIISGAMLLVALIGVLATFVAASTVPPVIYY